MGKFAVGDYVSTKKLVDVEKRLIIANNVPVCLGDNMVEYCGNCAVITAVTENGNYRLDIDGGNYAWHEDWLCRRFNGTIKMPSFEHSFTLGEMCDFKIEVRKPKENKNMSLANEEWKKHFRIKDVKIVVPNKVVEVTFEDRTKEKAVCAEEDTFSLDMAITVCIAKHLLGGSSAYNNAVRKANKILLNKAKAADKAKAEAEQKKKRVAKFEAYKKHKAEKKREQEIELRKEAYKRAIMELEDEKAAASCR